MATKPKKKAKKKAVMKRACKPAAAPVEVTAVGPVEVKAVAAGGEEACPSTAQAPKAA